MMRSLRKTLLALALGAWISGPVRATTLEPRDLRQVAAASTFIVHAVTVSSHSYWNDTHTLVLTDTRMRVLGAAKGTPGADFVVTAPGGRAGKLLVEVPGVAPFREGEEAILFVVHGTRGVNTVEGFSRGRFAVTVDGRTGARTVSGGLAAQLRAALPAGTPGKARPGDQPALASVLEDLRTLAQDVESHGGR